MAENSQPGQKRKYYKDKPEAVKKRNQERKKKGIESKIGFTCDSEEEKDEILALAKEIKKHLGEGNPNNISSKQLLKEVFGFYKLRNMSIRDRDTEENAAAPFVQESSFTCLNEDDYGEEQLFVTSQTNIEKFAKMVQDHLNACTMGLKCDSVKYFGHVGQIKLSCESKHCITWNSTPYLGTKFLGNQRILHGYFVSGMLQNQYTKFCTAAGIGALGDAFITDVFSKYANVVSEQTEENFQDVLENEIQSYPENYDGINILTDARHGTRKNSYHTDVVCIGANTHRVLKTAHVTKKDCSSTQKHELIGTKQIYEFFDSQEVKINVHCHDKNASVNKFIRMDRKNTTSTNDTWHATKNLTKEIKNVCSGPKYKECVTWHHELSDKASSIKTHVYWCMKNCQMDAEQLKSQILNIVKHYKNNHEHCHSTSRCKYDKNYESSKIIITDPKAEHLLTEALKKVQIYKNPQDYIHCMDTFYVESFNNALLQYQDKRINFTDKTYSFRTNLAVLDWNENVNRPATSSKPVQDVTVRQRSAKKVLKRKTFHWWSAVWMNYVDLVTERNIIIEKTV